MRIVTWNMSYWQRARESENAWRYLQDDLRPDLALLQETVPPAGLDPVQLVHREGGIGGTRKWGSAVVSFGVPIQGMSVARSVYGKRDVSILETHPGTVAVAETSIAGELYAFVSVYGLIDDRYADTTMHRIISDLTPLLDSARFYKRVILGGDFNVCTQWSGDRAHFRARDLTVFDRLRAFGLFDCVAEKVPADRGRLMGCGCSDEPCRHVRTQRHNDKADGFPWDNDYIFASEDLKSKLLTCAPEDNDGGWKWSGHCPVVAEFDM